MQGQRGFIVQREGIIILVRRIRFRQNDSVCARNFHGVCRNGRAVGFHIQRAVCHGELAAPNAKVEEAALRVRACNGHLAVLDGDVFVRSACSDCFLAAVLVISRKGEVCIFQRQRAIRKDSIGVGKGGCAGNGQLFRQFGIDPVGKIRIPVRREVCIIQGQRVGRRVKLHDAVAQHVALVGFRYLLACHPKVVGLHGIRVYGGQLIIGITRVQLKYFFGAFGILAIRRSTIPVFCIDYAPLVSAIGDGFCSLQPQGAVSIHSNDLRTKCIFSRFACDGNIASVNDEIGAGFHAIARPVIDFYGRVCDAGSQIQIQSTCKGKICIVN